MTNEIEPAKSPMQQFYTGQTILITGGTGFLGKLLIYKLLRSCPDLSSIYLILRPQKNRDINERLKLLVHDAIFDELRKELPKFHKKITAITGDCSLPGLGLSMVDKELIIRKVSVVFNVAANVKFNEKHRSIININVFGVKEIIELCKEIKNLQSVIHVSTAFSNCRRVHVGEKFYEPPITGDNIIKLVESLDDKKLDKVINNHIGDFPNNYAFTKCIAENVVKQYGKKLPIGIFRPAIVIATYREPLAGWIDHIVGATTALIAAGAGVLRTAIFNGNCVADLVPADLTVNALIATAWDVANSTNSNRKPPIYNYHSSCSYSITWRECLKLVNKHANKVLNVSRYSLHNFHYITKSLYLYYILSFIFQTVPAFIIDTGLSLIGKKSRLLRLYMCIAQFFNVSYHFSTKEWIFENANTLKIWNKMSLKDKETFNFLMDDFNWDEYMEQAINGLMTYKIKIDNQQKQNQMTRLFVLYRYFEYTVLFVLLWGLYNVLSPLL